jgi:hypothetical protein
MIALLKRDLAIATRSGGAAMLGVLFFLAVIAVVPFGVGPDLNLLARIGPAILWIGALLASLLGLDRLFQADREDGSLDMMIMAGWTTRWPDGVRQKCIAHWLDHRPAAGSRLAGAGPADEHGATAIGRDLRRRFSPARRPSPSSARPARRSPWPCRAAGCWFR